MSSTLSRPLRATNGFRSIPVVKGDQVTVISGKHKGKTGIVNKVRRTLYKVFVENVDWVKSNGERVPYGVDASSLRIEKLSMENGRDLIVKKMSIKKMKEKEIEIK